MADHDVKAGTLPAMQFVGRGGRRPTVAAMRTALAAHSATSYSVPRLNTMTYDDMTYAAQLHNLTVVGL